MALSGNDAFFYSSINNSTAVNAAVVDFSTLGLATNQVIGYAEPILTTNITTDGLLEGKSSLYYTDARARAALSAALPLVLNSGLFTLQYGSNLQILASRLDTIQNISITSSPTFASLTIGTLSGLLKATAGLVSIAASSDYVASITGTTNQIIASAATGAVTLSLPQSIATSSSITFARLLNSSIGTSNILIGTSSGSSLTSGGGNTFIGSSTGTGITSGTFNVAIGAGCLGGSGAMTATDGVNVAIGKNALYSCATTATDNVAIGFNALQSVTTGSNNIAIGNSMASSLTTGSNNIYLGHGTTPSAVSVSGECVLNVSATSVTGKGVNTCFINATAGVYVYTPYAYNLFNNNAAVVSHTEQWILNTLGGANIGTAPTITAGVLTGLPVGKYMISVSGSFYGNTQTLYPSIQYKASIGTFVTVAVIAVSFAGAWFSPMALSANVTISSTNDAIQLYYPTIGVYGAGNPGSDPSYYATAGNYLPRYMTINFISV